MSRMTATQVIALGEYLSPEFDPASLTVSQLLGIFGYHNIRYPSPYTKPKLVQLFNEEIKAKAPQLAKDRLKKESSQASDDGIVDGVTGKPVGREKVPLRRSSRQLSRAPSEQETSPIRPDPPKRRRSSAQPSLGGPSRRAPPVQPEIVEESEPEEEIPVRKVGRSRKGPMTAGSQARRVSGPDSGWEDNNVFQSGAESSSPARPSPARQRVTRKSVAPRKTRQSTSAPPQLSPPSSPEKYPIQRNVPVSPPQSKFEPVLPPSVARDPHPVQPRLDRLSFSPVEHNANSEEDTYQEPLDAVAELSQEDEEAEEDQSVAISRQIAAGGDATRRHLDAARPKSTSTLLRFFYFLLFLAGTAVVHKYKAESSSIGYCEAGSNTSRALEDLKVKWIAEEACKFDNNTVDHPASTSSDTREVALCPPFPLAYLPHPTFCTPCPEHATCSQYTISCDNGYLLKPHPLMSLVPAFQGASAVVPLTSISSPAEFIWKAMSQATDGLPGLGPIAFPPRCAEDPMRKRHIGALGKAVEAMLGQERGRRICANIRRVPVEDYEGGEARRWGVEIEKLKETMKKKTAPRLQAAFDDTFNEAIQQLVQWGGVFIGEDSEGNRYVAHKTGNFTWNCAVTVYLREMWSEWQRTVFAALGVLMTAYLGKARRTRSQIEGRRVAELVQIALDTLRNQELAHHTDPVTATQPYLSSIQLRDLILQDEHSVPRRRRLWDRVERVVEGNANVRTNLEEVHEGDELRVWRWVGSAGRRQQKKIQE